MKITLSQAQTYALETLIKQGQYSSPEEVLDAALLLLIDESMLSDTDLSPEYFAWTEATRRKIDSAQKQAQQGEVLEADLVLAQLRAKVQTTKFCR